jgi:DNA processing protein
MSIIKYNTLDEQTNLKLAQFLTQNNDPTEKEIICWLRLWKLWGKVNIFLAKFGCIFKTLEYITNLPSTQNLLLSQEEAQNLYEEAKKFGSTILIPTSKDYPSELKKIEDFPMVLYALGNIDLLKKPAFAIVGSRVASVEAMQISYNFAQELSKTGFAIVSGFANGIDTSACNGALKYGTIQVLGSGLKVPYPKNNTDLFKKVVENGGLFLTEFPLSSPAKPSNFPTRNRIITGLSKGVLIGQANRRNGVSGTLVTLRIAIMQGKEIFACPNSILDERSKICNDLLKNGTAHFTTSTEDILLIIGDSLKNTRSTTTKYTVQERLQKLDSLTQKEENSEIQLTLEVDDSKLSVIDKVYNMLSTSAISVNEITNATGLSVSCVQESLTELELCGKIIVNHIGKYTRCLI